MDKKFSSNHNENNEFTINADETDYIDLIIRLQEIRSTIALLDKQYLEEF